MLASDADEDRADVVLDQPPPVECRAPTVGLLRAQRRGLATQVRMKAHAARLHDRLLARERTQSDRRGPAAFVVVAGEEWRGATRSPSAREMLDVEPQAGRAVGGGEGVPAARPGA